jgi:hypothetical protein
LVLPEKAQKAKSPGLSDDTTTIPEKYPEAWQPAEAGGVQISEMGHNSSETSANVYEMPSQTRNAALPPSSPPSVSRKPVSPRPELAGIQPSKTSIIPSSENRTGDETDIAGSNSKSLPDINALPIASTSSSALVHQEPLATSGTQDDGELVSSEREMVQLQRKKERLQEKELERREEELRRTIEERKKATSRPK